MMDWAMSRPGVQDPALPLRRRVPRPRRREDVARHLAEYFDGVDVPKALDLGVDLADHVPFGAAIEARVARKNIARMAEQFIVGSTPAEAVAGSARPVAHGQRPHRRPARREDGRRRRGRPLPGPGARAARRPLRGGAVVGARRPPRARRPRPAAAGQRQHQAHGAGHALRAAQPHGGHRAAPRQRIRPILRLARERGRPRPLRHGALRRQGPHAAAVPRAAVARTSSPTWPPASSSRPTCATRATTSPTYRLVERSRPSRSPCGW